MTDDDQTSLQDPAMLELFRIEAENHSLVLGRDLLLVEEDPTPERIEPLMRASHSIKGAARIVGLGEAVTLAHAMEDVLTAALRGELRLGSDHVELLLEANDIFADLAQSSAEEMSARLRDQSGAIEEASRKLRQSLTAPLAAPAPASAPAPAAVAAAQFMAPEAPAGSAAAPPAHADEEKKSLPPPGGQSPRARADQGFVRVQADSLSRLMGMTGEFLVQTKAMESFSSALLRLKDEVRGVSTELALSAESLRSLPRSSGAVDRLAEPMEAVGRLHGDLLQHMDSFEQFSRGMERLANRIYDEVVASRMRPFADGVHGLARMVHDLAKELGKSVKFEVRGAQTPVDRDILEKIEAPLTHILRNAIDHGMELPEDREKAGKPPTGSVVLGAQHRAGLLHVTVEDDGRGIDLESVRRKVVDKGHMDGELASKLSDSELQDFLFLPGFTTSAEVTEISGRGVGLDVVLSAVREVGGSVSLDTSEGEGTTFHLRLPLTLSVVRSLLVEISGELFAFPMTRIDRAQNVPRDELQEVEDRQFCRMHDEVIGLVSARQVLDLPSVVEASPMLRVVVVSDRLSRYGVVVDRFVATRDLVVIPLDPRLGKVPNVSAGAVSEDGTPLLILDTDDLVRSIERFLTHGKPERSGGGAPPVGGRRKRVLVVDDSLTVREVERKLLTNAGYDVTMAVDGMDGWNTLLRGDFDLVLTDVDMPRLNGIQLIERIRENPLQKDVPVVIVSYKDREEDRARGLEVGANQYLTKSSFHDESLVRAVEDLIGKA